MAQPLTRTLQTFFHAQENSRFAAGLEDRWFRGVPGGKGSHRKLAHPRYRGSVTLSGQLYQDAKPYQEKQVRRAIEEVQT